MKKYYSKRIRSRKVRAIAKDIGIKQKIVKRWMCFVHPEAYDNFSTSDYRKQMLGCLRRMI